MRLIPLTDIIIKPDRQRQDFEPGALQDLKSSIEDRGLLHPPVLRQEGKTWVLVAGERRLKAMTEIYDLGGFFMYDGERIPDWCPLPNHPAEIAARAESALNNARSVLKQAREEAQNATQERLRELIAIAADQVARV